jgi:hypothetical protein
VVGSVASSRRCYRDPAVRRDEEVVLKHNLRRARLVRYAGGGLVGLGVESEMLL